MTTQHAVIDLFFPEDLDHSLYALEVWRQDLKAVPNLLENPWFDIHLSIHTILRLIQDSTLIALREGLSSPSILVECALYVGHVAVDPLDGGELHDFIYHLHLKGREESELWDHHCELALCAARVLLDIHLFKGNVDDWKTYRCDAKTIRHELEERTANLRADIGPLIRAHGQFTSLTKKVTQLESVSAKAEEVKTKQSVAGKKRAQLNADRDREITSVAQQMIAAGETEKLPDNLAERFNLSADRIRQILNAAGIRWRSH